MFGDASWSRIDQRGEPGDEEEDERRVDVAKADALVVDRREESGDARRVDASACSIRSSGDSDRGGPFEDRHYLRLSR